MILCPNFFLLILSLVGSYQDALGARNLSQDYPFSAALAGEDYILYWAVNFPAQNIRFAINVSTTGWVGFGLSPNGQMPGSDVVIGWVDHTSDRVMFHDRYAASRSLPSIDSSQDWFLTSGLEDNGRTILEFNRKLTTCDDNDMDIKADTARIIWSYNSQDPASYEELSRLQHNRQGSASLNLLGGLAKKRVEDNSNSFSVLNGNVTIPPDKDTTYWCTVHALPQEIVQQEHYLYKFSPVLSKPTAKYVHHLLAYLCTNLDESYVGSSQDCTKSSNIDHTICQSSGYLFAAWAVGGTDFIFPDGIAYPLGGKGQQYILIEMHYNNPDLDSGMVDSSGLKFFYVSEEPKNRAGILTLGQSVSTKMVIPPKADNFVVNALMPSQCTGKFFPEEGIDIFGNFHHTHLAGHEMVIRHLRETSTCGGLEELPPIDENRGYDFNYQQINLLPKTVSVLPGDILHLECSYQTTDSAYQTVTLGGPSTRQEMCLSFMYYYPETELTYCLGHQNISQEFTSQHFNRDTERALFRGLKGSNQMVVKDIFNQVEWNFKTIDSFQKAVHSTTYNALCINTTGGFSVINISDYLPQVVCPYKPPKKDCPTISGSPLTHHYSYLTLLLTILSLVQL